MSARNVAPVSHEQNLHVLPHAATSTSALVLDGDSLDKMMRLAEVMATGRATLPKHFNGNSADCLAVVMQAMQWRMNPFAVAQKTHLVNGVLGYEAQLVNAVITTCAPVVDRLHYEWYGNWEKVIGKFEIKKGDKGEYRTPGWKLADEEGLGVKVWATFRGEDEPRVLELLLAQARTRNSTLWADDPRQQLAYLATKRWSRLYCPDVILGVYSPDELEESAPRFRDVSPQPEQQGSELPAYEDDKFKTILPKWQDGIDTGKTDTESLIAFLESKYTLSADQIDRINQMAPIAGETA
ncbi:RecT protein [Pseudomonas cannabina pv. alisalensis]|uniref:RecT protein n=2 Tax=Pseudomonas cannabina TaxID=86840 RepID=A0A3M3QLI1_PSECA|nr:recombinase RecT [Pseudomonas cannabina]KPW23911.1 RecT protein [Pseudomonas cannabina pv. alisalensis]MBM0140163.1 recombinase RecT [Pseudomonas cannabina pv. alisalensis]RMN77522.1 RecT protein [Pseudomonas cannabina pv. alisalensis]RMN85086.1 RecT protein [Pseudomonas cannabina]RMO05616.1 RecT protein [Pseudomonas cannabina]